VISDMDQPLVPSLGNALEVAEVMRVLTGAVSMDSRIVTLCGVLGGEVLARAGLAADAGAGAAQVVAAIDSGAAADRFGTMIAAMGGPVAFLDTWVRFLPEATVIRAVKAPVSGFVQAIAGEALGRAVVALGGGRLVESDTVDPAVGLSEVVPLGSHVAQGDTLAVVHASRPDQADHAVADVAAAFEIGAGPVAVPPLVRERVG
jgi:thymidine phosphorylase